MIVLAAVNCLSIKFSQAYMMQIMTFEGGTVLEGGGGVMYMIDQNNV